MVAAAGSRSQCQRADEHVERATEAGHAGPFVTDDRLSCAAQRPRPHGRNSLARRRTLRRAARLPTRGRGPLAAPATAAP